MEISTDSSADYSVNNGVRTTKEVLHELKTGESVSVPLIYRLSDLTPEDFGEFCGEWATIDPDRRRVIVRHMADITEENYQVDFSEVFAHCLEDVSAEVRKASLDGLWDSERTSLIRPIIELMEHDPDLGVRVLAAATLGHYVLLSEWRQIPERSVAPILESLLGQIDDLEVDEAIRNAALESLAASGHPRVEPLIQDAYDSADLAAQKSALFAMGRSSDSIWIDIVIDELSSPLVEMRIEAARAAGEIGDSSAVPELIELTSDEDMEVRATAIGALGRIGGDLPRRFLQQILDDPDQRELHDFASEALDDMDWIGGEFDLSEGEF